MPKETVGPRSEHDPFLLEVGWSRDQDMQVGITLPEGETILTRLYGDDRCRSRIGEQFQAYLAELGLPSDYKTNEAMLEDYARLGGLMLYWADEARGYVGERDGLWTHPSRFMANGFIRLVRKARDAAFGRDE